MKVIINGDYLAYKTFAGVNRFATEVLYELDGLIDKCDVEVVTPDYAENLPKYENIGVFKYGRAPLFKWRQHTLPEYVKRQKGFLIDLTQALPVGISGITCIHDCIPELIPSAYSGAYERIIKKPLKLMQRRIVIRKSKLILAVSNHTREDIVRIHGVNREKVVVISNAWQHIKRIPYDCEILKKLGLTPRTFYFSLGSRVPHKNTRWLVEAAKQNSESIFVVSGENSFCKKFEKKIFPPNMIFTGYISDGEVRTLMANCKAFVFPSIYEGFGIPPMEALAEGAEIIISNTSCMPEIYGKSAHYIDPTDYDGISMDKILSGEVCPPQDVLNKYSWKKSAEVLCEIIRNLGMINDENSLFDNAI